mmetsp:Transcript_25167/g.76361  ORF Transcript_25167/g.76361 Transcript_25167/m.76361 type:complete len:309 (-) Transcript_25167:289-1215(-)
MPMPMLEQQQVVSAPTRAGQGFNYPKGMPKSVSHVLCSHKGSAMRDLHHAHAKHVERLKNMKPRIDMSVKPTYKMNNAKKEQEAAERNAAIERQNKMLLSKMYTIMNSENPYLNMKSPPTTKSLNIERRRQEYDRIARENQAIMQRILARGSNFDARKLDQEWKQTQKTLRSIAQEPWVLDGPTPPRRKLEPIGAEPAPMFSPRTSAAPETTVSALSGDPVPAPAAEPAQEAPVPVSKEQAPEPAPESAQEADSGLVQQDTAEVETDKPNEHEETNEEAPIEAATQEEEAAEADEVPAVSEEVEEEPE